MAISIVNKAIIIVHTALEVCMKTAPQELTLSPFPALGVPVAQSQWQSGGSRFEGQTCRTPEGQEDMT